MSYQLISTTLALLSVIAVAGSVLIVLAVGGQGAYALRLLVRERGRWMVFAVAATATAGSLYYSEIAHLPPCEMCWFQRIFMYPLSIVSLVAAINRDDRAWRYIVPLAAIGLLFSLYHYQLESFPEQRTFCTSNVPCSVRLVNEFGFISLAFMAGSGFISILLLQLAMWRIRRSEAGGVAPAGIGAARG